MRWNFILLLNAEKQDTHKLIKQVYPDLTANALQGNKKELGLGPVQVLSAQV